jgi:hypothetical protein
LVAVCAVGDKVAADVVPLFINIEFVELGDRLDCSWLKLMPLEDVEDELLVEDRGANGRPKI